MITVTETMVQSIPLLEVVEEGNKNKNIPVVVFYHGWTGCKESVLVHGYELARKGFRAVLPDALYHGSRKQKLSLIEAAMQFWPIIFNSVEELPVLKEHYEQKYKNGIKIGAAGLSMGGMTTSAILTKYPWVDAASILMRSVDPSGFTRWLLQSKAVSDVTSSIQLLSDVELGMLYKQLDSYSLEKQPGKIAGRPVHFWHATGDPVVPFWPTFDFYESIKDQPFAEKADFSVTEGGGHKVPYTEIQKMADFFENAL